MPGRGKRVFSKQARYRCLAPCWPLPPFLPFPFRAVSHLPLHNKKLPDHRPVAPVFSGDHGLAYITIDYRSPLRRGESDTAFPAPSLLVCVDCQSVCTTTNLLPSVPSLYLLKEAVDANQGGVIGI
jgi:hypothetical protein